MLAVCAAGFGECAGQTPAWFVGGRLLGMPLHGHEEIAVGTVCGFDDAVGGGGLTFPTRALMVLMLMGSLLVAFGAFSALLESGREPGRSFRPALVAVIAIGFVVIVVAMLLYLVIR